jgi:hypothetical protein
VLRTEFPYEPYVSDSGSVLSVQARSATLHLTSLIAYFLTHLLFLGKITEVPLYELDAQELRDRARAAMPYVFLSLLQHNMSLISDNVPMKVFLDCGINLDRWYPLSRRMLGTARFTLTHRREREHHRRALDTVRERFNVRCGPLVQ